MDLFIGRNLRHRIDIQRRSVATDEHGQQLKAWETVWHIPAAIEPISTSLTSAGKEVDTAQASNYEFSHKVTIRYVPGLDVKMRVLYGDRIFAIHAIQNIEERNRVIYLLCKEGLTDG